MLAKNIEKNIIIEHIYITILLLSIIATLIYFNPISESMTCDKHYKCTVTDTLFGNIESKNTIYLSPNMRVERMRSGFASRQEMHLALRELGKEPILPFKHGICGFNENLNGDYDRSLKEFNDTKTYIENYLEFPELEFSMKSVPYNNYLYKYTIVFITIYIILMFREFPISDMRKWVLSLLEER